MGAAIGLALAAEGANVIFADRDEDGAYAAVDCGDATTGKKVARKLDVTDHESVASLLNFTKATFGPIDILVNAAGVIAFEGLLDSTRSTLELVFGVNVYGLLFMMQAAAREMIERNKGGKIINIASVNARRPTADNVAYAASKSAVISLTQTAALTLAPHRINVNALAPGVVRTKMWDEIERNIEARGGAVEQFREQIAQIVPLGYFATPLDIAGAALFLAGNDSDYVTGQVINVDGGILMN